MLNRPQFKSHVRAEAVDGEGIFLLSEREGAVLLRGRLYADVAPLIDGRPVEELIRQLDGRVTLPEVYYTLGRLADKGWLTEADNAHSGGAAALWSGQGILPCTAAERLGSNRVRVLAEGAVAKEPLGEALQTLGVQQGEPASLVVVLTDDYLHSGLRAHNQEALAAGRPWLLVKPVGEQIWLGPLFVPGKTGCWECLARRLRGNRRVEAYLQERRGSADPPAPPAGFSSATLQAADGMAAHAVATWLVRGELPELEGKIVSLDLATFSSQSHALARLPQCSACGTPAATLRAPEPAARPDGAPLELLSRKKMFTADGGHRTISPEATLRRYEHLVSPITGLVPALVRSANGDGVVHVYGSGYNPARAAGNLLWLRSDLRSASSGKGSTDVQAKAGSLCEALERLSGCFRGDEPRRTARLADLGDAALHPNACMRYSDRQYAERERWNAQPSKFNHVPHPFDADATIEWTPLWSLTRQQVRYLPTAYCYYPSTIPEVDTCSACSNGNAAGNTLEEAILQGFLELVERDSVALWWYNRVRRPAVDLSSFAEPYLDELSEYLRRHGRTLWVLDLTSDLGIPVFAALSRREEGAERILFGFGAHLDARLAVLRAVTELNQMLAWVLPAEKNEQPLGPESVEDADTLEWLRNATVAKHAYLVPDAGVPARTAAAYPRQWTDDLRDDVLACQKLVERHGMEMLVLDQTRPDIGLPVVKVVVPGLRHFWARFAPGRLYDVPVRLGWLAAPLREEDLNPIPMFL